MNDREPPAPAEIMLDVTKAALRAGHLPPAEVIRHQLDALTDAGYHLHPALEDNGADLLRNAAKRALRSGHLAPTAVIARQLTALTEAGYSFVRNGQGDQILCESFEWGPSSFRGCARCGLSYWRHPGGVQPGAGAHRRA